MPSNVLRVSSFARFFVVVFTLPLILAADALAAQQVFSTDFESGLPAEFVAPGATIEPVGGYAGLGVQGNTFSGSFLRYSATTLHDTTLTLTNLPPHDRLDLKFLLAVIDSWDGTELLQIRVDGNLVFSHWFQLATGDSSSYLPPTGGLLSSGTNLGFSAGSYYERDRAYDMSVEPAFLDIPHTASSVTIVLSLDAVSGGAAQQWQGGGDESWAIENVRVEVSSDPVVPMLMGPAQIILPVALALAALVLWRRARVDSTPWPRVESSRCCDRVRG